MPPWSFLLVEFSAIILLALLFWEAAKVGLHKVATLGVAVLFGMAIELFFVSQYAGYEYGNFLLDPLIGGHAVPLWVGMGWGTIIYAAMQASDRTGIPWAARAPLDGLLAVSLDLTLDPVAEALGWWHWHRPGQYFGVPYDNFIGWVMIVGFISFFIRAGYKVLKPGSWWKDLLVPVVALVPAVLAVAGCQVALDNVLYPWLGEPLTFFLVASACMAGFLPFMWKSVKVSVPDAWYLTVIPAYYHGLMVLLLLSTGLYKTSPELLVLFPLALVTSLAAFHLGETHADAQAKEA